MENIDQRKIAIIYDIESYLDLFIIGMRKYVRETPESKYIPDVEGSQFFGVGDEKKFQKYCKVNDSEGALFVAFNNQNYDDLMISRYANPNMLKPTTDQNMRSLNDLIIRDHGNPIIGTPSQHISPEGMFYLPSDRKCLRQSKKSRAEFLPWKKSCDLMNLSGDGSLKMKAIVLNAESIVETPFSFKLPVGDRRAEVIKYLESDLDQTFLLYEFMENDLKIRDGFYEELPDIAYLVNSPQLADNWFRLHTTEIPSLKTKYFGKTFKSMVFCKHKSLEFNNPSLAKWWNLFCNSTLTVRSEHDKEEGTKFSDPLLSKISVDGRDDHNFTFGVGGMHSSDSNAYYLTEGSEYDTICELDANSYYPRTIIEYDVNPAHIPNFSKTMAKLVELRETFSTKENGTNLDIAKAAGYKLYGNSVFGKFADKYSYVFDTKCMYQITITNQILLLNLIDMLLCSGLDYKLVQQNTDAVVIQYKSSQSAILQSVKSAWETLTRHKLGMSPYKSFYQLNVNNYFAVKTNGKIKDKGAFVLAPRISQKLPIAKIVKIATIEYLLNGTEPMKTIRECTDITKFLISANSTDFVQDEKELGYKAIRVVYALNGSPIYALKNDNINGGFKRSILLEEEKLAFLPKLSETSNVEINYDRYCWDSWKQIYQIIKPRNDNEGDYFIPAKLDEYNWQHIKLGIRLYNSGIIGMWDQKLKSYGFSVMPKSICKCNYKGLRTKHPETWGTIDNSKALGLAIVCSNAVSIDIDNPTMLDPELKRLLLKYPTMRTWHGECNLLNGGKGAFIFLGNPALKSVSSLVNSHGFEFFNDDGKVQTVMGVHPKNELYYISGTPIEIPEEIVEYLRNLKTAEGKRAIPRIGERATAKKSVVEDVIKLLDVDKLSTMLESNGIKLRATKVEDSGGTLHCWDYEGHWFVVSYGSNDKLIVGTNQSNFAPVIKNVIESINTSYNS